MLFWSKWSYSVSRAGEHYSSFHSKFKNTTDTIYWSVRLSSHFLVLSCSLDTIWFFYGRIPICGNHSMASLWKHQFVYGYRWYLLILCGIDHIFNPYLHFSRLVQYGKLWERVCYSISNLRISHDCRVLHAGSFTILCFFRKRANPYVVRSWASYIRWGTHPLQEPCAVNPLRADRPSSSNWVVPAKLSGRRVVLCVGIAFPVEPVRWQTSIYFLGSWGTPLRWVPRTSNLNPPTRVLYGYAGKGAPRCRDCAWSREVIPRKAWGADTLARIRVTATRKGGEEEKGNCTRPGMDVNS